MVNIVFFFIFCSSKKENNPKTYQIQSKFDPDMLTNPDPISILLEGLWISVCCYAFGRCCNQFMHSLALPIQRNSLLFQVQNFLAFYSISYGSNSSKICVAVWLSGRALRQLRKRLWVRFPGNTCTYENV